VKPINEKMKLVVRPVNTFRSNVFVTTKPMKNRAISDMVTIMVHVVRFARLIFVEVFIFAKLGGYNCIPFIR
jgi:hypothetical protein